MKWYSVLPLSCIKVTAYGSVFYRLLCLVFFCFVFNNNDSIIDCKYSWAMIANSYLSISLCSWKFINSEQLTTIVILTVEKKKPLFFEALMYSENGFQKLYLIHLVLQKYMRCKMLRYPFIIEWEHKKL